MPKTPAEIERELVSQAQRYKQVREQADALKRAREAQESGDGPAPAPPPKPGP